MSVVSAKLTNQEKRIIGLSALGGMLEFYDFVIYGIFSVYFAQQFFPSENAFFSILQSYSVFVLGYLARPLGGIIFSHVGDEYGRKKVLIITIALMGFSSLGIGLLPTFAQINFFAPILLLLLRFLQGLALGGELPSTYVYISESIPKKLGVSFGAVMFGVNSGLLLGMIVNHVINFFLTHEQIINYGWRLPFIFGGLICLVSYRIRKALQETAAFTKIHDKPALPIVYLLKHQSLEVLAGIAATAVMSGLVVVAIVFMPTYLHEMLGIDHQTISYTMLLVMVVNVIAIYITGLLVDKFNLRFIFRSLLIMGLVLVPCSYLLIKNTYLTSGLLILGILEGMAAMMVPLFLTYLFPTNTRLTGVALCYNISFTVFGGMAPLFITTLIHQGYNIYLTPACYLMIMILICGVGYSYARSHSAVKVNL